MRYATFNVLADAYTGYGDYSRTDPELLLPSARLEHTVQYINELGADVVGLQEAEVPLLKVLEETKKWQTLWSQKGRNKPDGCLTLVGRDIEIDDYDTFSYNDGSGHVFQITHIGGIAIANTHIKWAPLDDIDHIGVAQTRELLDALGNHHSAAILADCNDRLGGPVRGLIEKAGFYNVSGDSPTAVVDGEPVALDLLAVRGVSAQQVSLSYDLNSIPSVECPSDHIAVVVDVEA